MNRGQTKLIFPTLIYLCSFTLYLKCLCPTIYVGDAGELVTASSTLGIPHNPGYPIYSLLGKLFTFIPFGSHAFRLNFLSAFFGAGSVLVVYLIFSSFFKNRSISSIIALVYCSAATLWNVSVSSEVYSLYAFFTSLVILLTVLFHKRGDLRCLFLLVFSASLALANHIAISLILPPLLIPIVQRTIEIKKAGGMNLRKILFTAFILFVVGVSLYLYLPLRASTDPAINWSDTKSFGNLLYHLTLTEHRTVALSRFSWDKALERSKELAIFILDQFPPWVSLLLILFFIVGLFRLLECPQIMLMMLLIIVLNFFYILFFNDVPLNVTGFGFPSYIAISFVVLGGVFWSLKKLSERANPFVSEAGVLMLLILVFLSGGVYNYHPNNRKDNYCAYDFIRNMMLTPRKGSALFVDGDNQTFLSLYSQAVEGFREDLRLYSFASSGCRSLAGFEGFIYSRRNGVFRPEEIDRRIRQTEVYYSADPMNLKHTKLLLQIAGVLYRAVEKNEPALDRDIWKYQTEDCFLDQKIYRDILTRELTSKYYLRKGAFEYLMGNVKEAEEYLNFATEEGRDIYFILYEIALQYIKMGVGDRAITSLTKSIKLKGDFIKAYLSLSDLYKSKGLYSQAIEVLSKAYTLHPTDRSLLRELGETLNEMGEFEKARIFINKSIDVVPEDPINYYNLGNSYLGLGNCDEAIRSYKLAISMGAKALEVFNNLGNALKACGDYYGAASKYKAALSIDPEYVPAMNNLGLVYTKLKRFDLAAELYKKALELAPDIAGIYCNLGTLYNDYLGDPGKAEYYWERYIALAPDTQQAGVISAKLTEIRLKKK